jgi:hypothetical protein
LRVFEKKVLKFRPKGDEEVTGGWKRLHHVDPHKLYISSSIIRMMKLMKMRWAEHVAPMEDCGEKARRIETIRNT